MRLPGFMRRREAEPMGRVSSSNPEAGEGKTANLIKLSVMMADWHKNQPIYILPFHDDHDTTRSAYKNIVENKRITEILSLLKTSGFNRRELLQAWSLAKLSNEEFLAFDQWQFDMRQNLDPEGLKAYIAGSFARDYKGPKN